MRVVLDTNVLLVSLPPLSRYHPIFKAFVQNKFTLLLSNEIYLEYLEIIAQKASSFVAARFTEFIYKQENLEVVTIYYQWNLIIQDGDDNKFSDCAIAAKADYLVTNDTHFNVLKKIEFPKIRLVTIDEFLKLVEPL